MRAAAINSTSSLRTFGASAIGGSVFLEPIPTRRSCCTTTPLSRVATRFGKAIRGGHRAAGGVGRSRLQEIHQGEQSRGAEGRLSAELRSRRPRLQHPRGDLEPRPRRLHDRYRAVGVPRSADDRELKTEKGVEGIVDSDLGSRTQGTLFGGSVISTSTCWSRPAV
jgi:hypothetical protein